MWKIMPFLMRNNGSGPITGIMYVKITSANSLMAVGLSKDYTIVFIIMIMTGLTLVLLFFFRIQLRRERLKRKLLELESKAIRAQMNPHFIFNAISSIQNYILTNDAHRSYNYLSKFALLIRNVLDNSKEEYLKLSKEINGLNLYIELEQLRFEESFNSIINIDKDIDVDKLCIPTMLIQPCIENAIWHGLMPKQKNATLMLKFRKQEDQLNIIISDNGVGREESKKYKTNLNHISKGIDIIKARLVSLASEHQKKYSLTVIDLKDENDHALGTEVSILIPLFYI